MDWYYNGYYMGWIPELKRYIRFVTYEEYLECYNSQ